MSPREVRDRMEYALADARRWLKVARKAHADGQRELEAQARQRMAEARHRASRLREML